MMSSTVAVSLGSDRLISLDDTVSLYLVVMWMLRFDDSSAAN